MALFYCDTKINKVFILDKLDFTNRYSLNKTDFYYNNKDTIIPIPRSACNEHKAMNITLLIVLLLGLKTSAGIFSAAAFNMNFLSNIHLQK
jgi:hypothetical protein